MLFFAVVRPYLGDMVVQVCADFDRAGGVVRTAHQLGEVSIGAYRHRHIRICLQKALQNPTGVTPEPHIGGFQLCKGLSAVGGAGGKNEVVRIRVASKCHSV